MKEIAIIGHGIIGNSWALVFARAGMEVAIWDHRAVGRSRVLSPMEVSLTNVKGTTLAGQDDIFDRIMVSPNLKEVVGTADYIQESVSETLAVKQALYERIEACCLPDAIIASSTSGILPSLLGAGIRFGQRFLVAHPLTPPHLLPVVEVVPASFTCPDVTSFTCDLLGAAGQSAIVLQKEIRGFVANRLLAALLNEYFLLVRDGVLRAEDADRLMTDGFALRWACIGPFAGMDLNAPGGIGDYLTRYGALFQSIVAERGTVAGLDEQVISELTDAMSKAYSPETAVQRAAMRDQKIARVRSSRDIP